MRDKMTLPLPSPALVVPVEGIEWVAILMAFGDANC
jgi:hypothetical protein